MTIVSFWYRLVITYVQLWGNCEMTREYIKYITCASNDEYEDDNMITLSSIGLSRDDYVEH
jgi:hypothetical protein